VVRAKWEDGTPAHTIKRFAVVNRYDLTKEFPALTLRPTPVKSAKVSRGQTTTRGQYVLTMVATGYDGCYECNKPYYGKPAFTGMPLQRGVVAVDPRVIPMGTRLYVEGYGEAIAADQGNAIKGNRIDLFFDSHQQARQWGMKTVKVTVLGK
jgi:3D (Asp-Asp-Asp) domain-containing protein